MTREREARRASRLLDGESDAANDLDPAEPMLAEVYGLPEDVSEPGNVPMVTVYGMPAARRSPSTAARNAIVGLVLLSALALGFWFFR